ncbi:hypothetical protein V501_07683 [Pseudogymnoascus sp. VKM F-4519 (FW-2642)]|nr:hypothetical protein V501_07683 [Pseudogymnoascus sp. VKM F-4519 (FW-2642)]
MIQLPPPPPATHPRMTQRRSNKPILPQRRHCPRCSISNIPPLPYLDFIRVPATPDTQLGGFGAAVGPEEGLPVVRDAEDEVGACEGGDECFYIVEVGGYDFDAEGGEGLGCGGGGVASDAADAVGGVEEEAAGDGAALVAGYADDAD